MKKNRIIDLHQDILLHQNNPSIYKYKNQTSLQSILDSNIDIVFSTGFAIGENCLKVIQQDFDIYTEFCQKHETCIVIKHKDDIEKINNNSNLKGIIFHIEGLNDFQDNTYSWEMLEQLYQQGLRSVGIVWTKNNNLGGGDEGDLGLTELGKKFIRWANNKNIILDYAHMNEKTFYDVCALSSKPVCISHGNARSICDKPRNYTDDQLLQIKNTNGLIGVFFANSCLIKDGLATITDVIKHITYIKDLIGIDYIALGTDLGGLTVNIPEGLRSVSELDNLAQALIDNGYNIEDVEKIFYLNAYNFLLKNI